jgi:hypothetical protein
LPGCKRTSPSGERRNNHSLKAASYELVAKGKLAACSETNTG